MDLHARRGESGVNMRNEQDTDCAGTEELSGEAKIDPGANGGDKKLAECQNSDNIPN